MRFVGLFSGMMVPNNGTRNRARFRMAVPDKMASGSADNRTLYGALGVSRCRRAKGESNDSDCSDMLEIHFAILSLLGRQYAEMRAA